MDKVQKALENFRNQRGWGQTIRPDSAANLAKSVVIEAAELLEHFQWSETNYDTEQVGYEIADVYVYLILLANYLGVNLNQLGAEKVGIEENNVANLAKAVAIEAAELLKQFWSSEKDYDLKEVKSEIRKTYSYLLALANHLSLDLNKLALAKLKTNEKRFPAPPRKTS